MYMYYALSFYKTKEDCHKKCLTVVSHIKKTTVKFLQNKEDCHKKKA